MESDAANTSETTDSGFLSPICEEDLVQKKFSHADRSKNQRMMRNIKTELKEDLMRSLDSHLEERLRKYSADQFESQSLSSAKDIIGKWMSNFQTAVAINGLSDVIVKDYLLFLKGHRKRNLRNEFLSFWFVPKMETLLTEMIEKLQLTQRVIGALQLMDVTAKELQHAKMSMEECETKEDTHSEHHKSEKSAKAKVTFVDPISSAHSEKGGTEEEKVTKEEEDILVEHEKGKKRARRLMEKVAELEDDENLRHVLLNGPERSAEEEMGTVMEVLEAKTQLFLQLKKQLHQEREDFQHEKQELQSIAKARWEEIPSTNQKPEKDIQEVKSAILGLMAELPDTTSTKADGQDKLEANAPSLITDEQKTSPDSCDVKELESQLKVSQDEVTSLKKQLSEQNKKLKAMDKEKDKSLKDLNDILIKQISDTDAYKAEQEKLMEKLTTSITFLEKSTEEMENSFVIKKNQLIVLEKTTQEKLVELEETNDKLKQDLVTSQASLKEAKDLVVEKERIEEEKKQAETQLEETTKVLATLLYETALKDQELEPLKERNKSLQLQIDTLKETKPTSESTDTGSIKDTVESLETEEMEEQDNETQSPDTATTDMENLEENQEKNNEHHDEDEEMAEEELEWRRLMDEKMEKLEQLRNKLSAQTSETKKKNTINKKKQSTTAAE